jgi:hypothetical protein
MALSLLTFALWFAMLSPLIGAILSLVALGFSVR